MPIPTRPTGSSILSDIATAGSGFAIGLKQEKERQRQEALQAALQKFDMDMKKQQLGFEARQTGIQEAGLRLQQDNARADEAQRIVQNRFAQQQLEAQEKDRLAKLEQDRLDRKLRYDQLEAEIEWRKADMLSRERIAGKEATERGLRDHSGSLNTLADNIRQEINAYNTRRPDIAAMMFKPNAEQEMQDELSRLDPKSPRALKIQTDLLDLGEYTELLDRQRRIGNSMYANAEKLGLLTGVANTASRRWDNFTPEEKAISTQAMIDDIKTSKAVGDEPNLQKWIDLGVSRDEIRSAVQQAQMIQEAEMVAPTPTKAKPFTGGTGPALQSKPNPLPNMPTPQPTGPAYQSTAIPGFSTPPQTPPSLTQQSTRSPYPEPSSILSPSMVPNFQPRPFYMDKNAGLHRIQPRRPF